MTSRDLYACERCGAERDTPSSPCQQCGFDVNNYTPEHHVDPPGVNDPDPDDVGRGAAASEYRGEIDADQGCVVFRVVNGELFPLDPRSDLANHSCGEFNWGYLGSGPSQLALALCADALGDDREALEVYHDVKRELIGPLPQGKPWRLTAAQIREAAGFEEDLGASHAL